MTPDRLPGFKIVISGSFRKFYREIVSKAAEFQKNGFRITSPKDSTIINPGAEFVILESDGEADAQQIEQKHLDAILEADALFVFNPGGYCGNTTILELGWALAFCKPIFFQEQCVEKLFNNYGEVVPEPSVISSTLMELEKIPYKTICKRTPVSLLQKYIHKVVTKRGFDSETPRDIVLLMVEEIGELAKAIRKFSGLKVDPTKASTRGNLEEELADVFIYLLDLSNSCGVDLFSALYDKEIINEQRTWVTQSPKILH